MTAMFLCRQQEELSLLTTDFLTISHTKHIQFFFSFSALISQPGPLKPGTAINQVGLFIAPISYVWSLLSSHS